MRNKNTILSNLKKDLDEIHIIWGCLKNGDNLTNRMTMKSRLKEAGYKVYERTIWIDKTYNTKGFHVYGNQYSGDYMLRNRDFSGLNLSGWDFSHVKIVDCDFSNCNLSNTNFEGAVLEYVRLNNADMTKANFKDVDFRLVRNRKPLYLKASGAIFDNANIRSANLSKSDFSYASMRNMDLSFALFDSTDFRCADLSNSCLYDVELINTNLDGATLDNVSLEKASLMGLTDLDKSKSAANIHMQGATISTNLCSYVITSWRELISIICLILFVIICLILFVIIGLGIAIK